MKPKTKQLSAADVCSMACDMRRQGWPVSVWDEMHENKTAQQWRQLYHRLLADIQTGSEAYIRQTDRQRGIYQTDRQTDRQTYSSAVCVCVCVCVRVVGVHADPWHDVARKCCGWQIYQLLGNARTKGTQHNTRAQAADRLLGSFCDSQNRLIINNLKNQENNNIPQTQS